MKVIEAKIVVLGSQGVGKTSMVVRYIGKMFSKHISPTIGASFFTCKINLDEATVKLQVWDTAGQERFRSMAPMYYRSANAALLVYDISSYPSFHAIQGWIKELKSNVPEPMVLILVGNKSDLEEARAVSRAEAERFAAAVGAEHAETSAKTDQGIEQVFLSAAQALLRLGDAAGAEGEGEGEGEGRSACTISTILPRGTPTEEEPTHVGKVEMAAWSIESIAHGEMQKNCC